MPHTTPSEPILLPPEPFGEAEGELCRRDGCPGRLQYSEPEGCSCHIVAPCAACTDVRLYCPDCLWEEE